MHSLCLVRTTGVALAKTFWNYCAGLLNGRDSDLPAAVYTAAKVALFAYHVF